MKKFILKTCLFIFGCFLVILFEYLISVQYSSFRTPSNNLIFETTQYPYLNEYRTVFSDLNNKNKKNLRYITNNKGSRSIINDEIEIAIIGDSFSELNNIGQKNTIQGNLNYIFKRRAVSVRLNYPLNKFNNYVGFLSENYNKPKTVILLIVERNIENLIYDKVNDINFLDKPALSLRYSNILKFINEGIDFPSLRSIKKYLSLNKNEFIQINNLLFLQGEKVKTFDDKTLRQFETSIINLNEQLKALNINFIVAIVPNKETYYKNFFNNVTEENMLSIDSILSKNNISRINLLEKFKGIDNMFEKYDTHLSEHGAEIVSFLINNKIDSLEK